MSRNNTAYVSLSDGTRAHEMRLLSGATQTLTLNLNAALPAGVTASAVTLEQLCQSVATLGTPAIADRAVTVQVQAMTPGRATIDCTITTSDPALVIVAPVVVWVQ